MCFVSMTPFTKSSRCSVMDKYVSTACPVGPNAELSQSMIHKTRASANVQMPAITWLDVMLEMNKPTAMNAAPNSNMPR